MAALRETAVGRRASKGMLGPYYWNAGMSLLFGMGFLPPMSTRCSPVTSSCNAS
jgi:hypothetical protein